MKVMMNWQYSFKYKISGWPWSQKKVDMMEPWTSHSISYLKFKILFDHPNMTFYVMFRFPHIPNFYFRVLQMSCIWKNIIKSSFPTWSIWLEIRNRMIEKDFEFQTWHAIKISGLQIFLLLTSGLSRCLVFERIFSNHYDLHDEYD